MQLLNLCHHVGVDVQTARRIDDYHIVEAQLCLGERRLADIHGFLLGGARKEIDTDIASQGLKLFDGRWPVDIGTHEQYFLLFFFL